ncbi:hypothetical protein [Streptomyces sp. NPDC020489]
MEDADRYAAGEAVIEFNEYCGCLANYGVRVWELARRHDNAELARRHI